MPASPNTAPLKVLTLVLAIVVTGMAGYTALAALDRPDDSTPRTATERALIDARAAIEANPRDVEARLQLARVYIGMGQVRSAVTTLEAAREIAPEDMRVLHLIGLAYLESGDAATALGYLEEAAEIDGGFGTDYAAIWSDIARARTLQDDLEGAVDAYDQALVYAPQAADIVFQLATVYERLDRIDEAIPAYEGVLKFVPDHEEAQAALSRLSATD